MTHQPHQSEDATMKPVAGATPPRPAGEEVVLPEPVAIYVASRASVEKYPREWRRLRAEGWPINSSWIDEAGPGETADMGELWQRIEREVRAASGVVLWAEEEDFPLKGAFIEVGMALGMGKPVAVYTKVPFENHNCKPFGSWMNHPLVHRAFSLNGALEHIRTAAVHLDREQRMGGALSDAPARELPHPGSPEASAMLDSMLAEYQWPANTKNAARAGWEAANRWLRLQSSEPANPGSGSGCTGTGDQT